jgi:hypothetical protein
VLLAGRFSTRSLGTIAAGITMAIVPALIVFAVAQRDIVHDRVEGTQALTAMSNVGPRGPRHFRGCSSAPPP